MIEIQPYDPRWPTEFAELAHCLRQALGDLALRIDHIGSTSVPGLSAKDIIDAQVTVASINIGGPVEIALESAGFVVRPGIWHDHLPPGYENVSGAWEKRLAKPATGQRPANIHVRVTGQPNQRYALLFRDYLRAHPRSAAAYAELKRRLARHLGELHVYADVKDPACDLIFEAAEAWAARVAWEPGPSDA
jgi:GrpB-like predicted nucleotidyltransferase (UPF0157 family)